MKIKCDAKAFVENVSLLRGVVPTSSPLPVLAGILLQGGGDKISLTGRRLENAIKVELDAEIEGEIGPVVLPGRKLIDICGKLPLEADAVIVLESASGGIVKLKYKRSVFTLRVLSPDQFPKFPDKPEGDISIPAETLRGVLSKAVIAVSSNQTRPMICGVYLKCENGILTAVATETKILVYATAPYDYDFEGVIVPTEAVKNILRICSGGDMWLSIEQNQLLCGQEGRTVSSLLIEAKYIDYETWLDTVNSYTKSVVCDRDELLNAVEGACLLSNPLAKLPIYIDGRDDTLTIDSDLADIGGAHNQIAAECSGVLERMCLNGEYLRKLLMCLDSERVVIGYDNPDNALRLTAEGGEDAVCMVMPIRIPHSEQS
jgi:DNA polymerase-3 subunit beta